MSGRDITQKCDTLFQPTSSSDSTLTAICSGHISVRARCCCCCCSASKALRLCCTRASAATGRLSPGCPASCGRQAEGRHCSPCSRKPASCRAISSSPLWTQIGCKQVALMLQVGACSAAALTAATAQAERKRCSHSCCLVCHQKVSSLQQRLGVYQGHLWHL